MQNPPMTLATTFANGRNLLPNSASYYSVQPGGAPTQPRTLHLVIQGENPAGCNFISAAAVVTIAAGQRLQISLPQSLQLAGEKWDAFVISASPTGVAGSFRVLSRIPTTDPLGVLLPFPLAQILSTDDHFGLGVSVANPAALPANPAIGSRRGVLNAANGDPLGFVYEFQAGSVAIADGATVLPAANGRWLRVGGFSTEVADLASGGGARQDIRLISEQSVRVQSYACNGSNSRPSYFWLANMGANPIPSGQRVMINVSINDVPRSAKFEGLIRATFWGYVNINTGTIRTTFSDNTPMRGIGEEIVFENRKTDLLFEDDLQPGEAYLLSLSLNLIPAYLNGEIPTQAIVKVFPTIAVQAGSYSEAGEALGDLIYPEYDRSLIVPGRNGTAIALKGSGVVNSRSFIGVAPDVLNGIPDNATTKILINGDGDRYPETTLNPQLPNEAIRAIAKKQVGVSNPSPWSAPVVLAANSTIEITLTHPSNGSNANIRANYPDFTIAGLIGKAQLNAIAVDIYIRNGTTIKRWTFGLIDAATQVVQITDWGGGSVISSVPVAPSVDFCLFEPISAIATQSVGAGTFSGSHEVAFAYRYDGTAITSVSHSILDGCLPTLALTIGEIEESAKSWATGVPDLAALRNLSVAKIHPYQARFVLSVNDPYRFDPTSQGVDDGTPASRYVRPSHIPVNQPGRFVQDDSATWYWGEDEPLGTLGEIGSFYARSTGEIYEKTAATAWTRQFKIKGANWLRGAGNPAALLGEMGDFYLKDSTGTYWEKTGSGWVERGAWRVDLIILPRNPLLTDGKVGDRFINNVLWSLWERDSSGWQNAGSFKGTDGDDGTRIWSVSGTPSNGLGAVGDFAITTSPALNVGDFWYKPGSDTWDSLGSLRGPQGSQGPPGSGGGGGTSGSSFVFTASSAPTLSAGEMAIFNAFGVLKWAEGSGNTYAIASLNKNQLWTKPQRSEKIEVDVIYNSGTNSYSATIDCTLSNSYCIAPQDDAIIAAVNIQPGTNFNLIVLWGDGDYSPTQLFWSAEFRFAGGDPIVPPTTPAGTPFTVFCTEHDGDLLCQWGGPY
jgi:hypothetical protein